MLALSWLIFIGRGQIAVIGKVLFEPADNFAFSATRRNIHRLPCWRLKKEKERGCRLIEMVIGT